MKRTHQLAILLAAMLLLSGCGTDGRFQINLITDGSHTISETLYGDMVVIGGEVILSSESGLNGSLHIFQGRVKLAGEVVEDVEVFGGELVLEPGARIGGGLNQASGQISGFEAGQVDGEVFLDSGPDLPGSAEGDRGKTTSLLPTMLGSLFGAGLAVLAQRFAPRNVQRTAEAALRYPLIASSMGVLVGIVGLTLLILMAYTILLIPVTLLGLVVLTAAVVFGWLACGLSLGSVIQEKFLPRWGKAVVNFLAVFIFLAAISQLGVVPLVGGIVQILIALAGLGAVFLTRFGFRQFKPAGA